MTTSHKATRQQRPCCSDRTCTPPDYEMPVRASRGQPAAHEVPRSLPGGVLTGLLLLLPLLLNAGLLLPPPHQQLLHTGLALCLQRSLSFLMAETF